MSRLNKRVVVSSPSRIITLDRSQATNAMKLSRHWDGAFCRSSVTNTGAKPVRIKEIVLFEIEHALPAETRLYGEGFQMLSQTGGTLASPVDYGGYTDAKHYKMPIPEGARAFYGMMTLAVPGGITICWLLHHAGGLTVSSCSRKGRCKPSSIRKGLS